MKCYCCWVRCRSEPHLLVPIHTHGWVSIWTLRLVVCGVCTRSEQSAKIVGGDVLRLLVTPKRCGWRKNSSTSTASLHTTLATSHSVVASRRFNYSVVFMVEVCECTNVPSAIRKVYAYLLLFLLFIFISAFVYLQHTDCTARARNKTSQICAGDLTYVWM